MPDNPVVWYVVAGVIALVFIVAILRGKKHLTVTGPGGTSAQLAEERKVSVADGVTFENAKVGNVTGSRSEAGSTAAEVSVMNKAVVKGGEFGDITGEEIKVTPPKSDG